MMNETGTSHRFQGIQSATPPGGQFYGVGTMIISLDFHKKSQRVTVYNFPSAMSFMSEM